MNLSDVYESRDLIRAVGISSTYLNQLVERGLFGIKPSLRSGESRGSRRWFSRADALGVAMVWWLFEAGLRAGSGRTRRSVVQDIINQICGKPGSSANDAARILSDLRVRWLVIIRQPHVSRFQRPQQVVHQLNDEFEVTELLTSKLNQHATIIVVPVGNLFLDLENQ